MAPKTFETETELSSVIRFWEPSGNPHHQTYVEVEETKAYPYTKQDGTPGAVTVTSQVSLYQP